MSLAFIYLASLTDTVDPKNLTEKVTKGKCMMLEARKKKAKQQKDL